MLWVDSSLAGKVKLTLNITTNMVSGSLEAETGHDGSSNEEESISAFLPEE